MGLSGAAFGAAQSLEEILAAQMFKAKLAQQQAEDAQRMKLEEARLNETLRQNEIANKRQTMLDDRVLAGDRQKTNEREVRRMIGEGITRRVPLDDMQGMAFAEGIDLPQAPKVERDPIADHEAKAKIDARYRQPTRDAEEPLVAIMGPDGVPTLVRRSQAEGKRPASTREQGRPVQVSSAKDMSDIDEALKLAHQLDFKPSDTGVMPSLGAAAPDFVTNLTGFGVADKQRQGIVNLVKQIIGKGLEGGVLRKEDESKYEKMLPTLSDHPDVAQTKIKNLINTMEMKRSTLLDSLTDAGFDTSKFIERGAPGGGKDFSVKAPNGKTYTFKSAEELAAFKAKAGLQ